MSSIVAPSDSNHFAADFHGLLDFLVEALEKILFRPAEAELTRAIFPQLAKVGPCGRRAEIRRR